MRLSTLNNATLLFTVVFVAGCAAPAPSLPRVTSQASELGFQTPGQGGRTSGDNKPIALIVSPVWSQLSDAERADLSARFDLKLLDPEQYGVVLDSQGVDESSKGTNAGTALGAAVGSAAYIDHAFRGSNNYSAGGHLALGLLGAAIGSTLDKPTVSQFHFRYTVKLGDGDVKYFDEVKSTQFRHSVGVCLAVPELSLISIHTCNQTVDSVRARLLTQRPSAKIVVPD